jgi:hypothetical protein
MMTSINSIHNKEATTTIPITSTKRKKDFYPIFLILIDNIILPLQREDFYLSLAND